MRKVFLTFFSVILFLCCGAVWAEIDVKDENRINGAKGEINTLGQEALAWAKAALSWQKRRDSIGYMGPYVRTGQSVATGNNTTCPEVPPDDPNNPQKEKPPVDYGVQPNLRAIVNMMEKCAKNEYNQEFESFTMPILLRSLQELLDRNAFQVKPKYRWPFPGENTNQVAKVQGVLAGLTLATMADIVAFRDYAQRYLTVVSQELARVPAGLAVEERRLAHRFLKQSATQFLFVDALTNHSLSAENDWRHARGDQLLNQAKNLREDMQALNFVTIQLLSESARSVEMMGAFLGKTAMDGFVREENNLFNKRLAGQGG